MPRSVHRTREVAFAKARKLEKQGKSVKFDLVISQKMKKGKLVGKQKRDYIVIWR